MTRFPKTCRQTPPGTCPGATAAGLAPISTRRHGLTATTTMPTVRSTALKGLFQPLGIAPPIGDVVDGRVAVCLDLLRRELPHRLARHPHDQRSGRHVRPSGMRAPAAIRQSWPMVTPFITVAPMPTSVLSPIVQPWMIARWPMVQPVPTVSGKPMSVWKMRAFLHVRVVADGDALVVATHHRAEPHADALAERHLADDRRGGRHPELARGRAVPDAHRQVRVLSLSASAGGAGRWWRQPEAAEPLRRSPLSIESTSPRTMIPEQTLHRPATSMLATSQPAALSPLPRRFRARSS